VSPAIGAMVDTFFLVASACQICFHDLLTAVDICIDFSAFVFDTRLLDSVCAFSSPLAFRDVGTASATIPI
jgi:hypothetical protein